MKYRTKPCEIEAVQWTGYNSLEIQDFIDKNNYEFKLNEHQPKGVKLGFMRTELFIHTLEGTMRANRGDYIIRGLRGEYYPCKPDVFHKKYELVGE